MLRKNLDDPLPRPHTNLPVNVHNPPSESIGKAARHRRFSGASVSNENQIHKLNLGTDTISPVAIDSFAHNPARTLIAPARAFARCPIGSGATSSNNIFCSRTSPPACPPRTIGTGIFSFLPPSG